MLEKRMAPVLCDSDTTCTASMPLVSVRALSVSYTSRAGGVTRTQALTDVNLDIPRGGTFGILGESGCGKSTLLLSLLNLLPDNAATEGSVMYGRRNLLKESEKELARIRGAQIGFVTQEAGTALNPLRRVGGQVAEVLRAHRKLSRRDTFDCARESLEMVGLDADRVFDAWPHQLSGGQRQRVLIAQALVCNPSLLLADEPTHSLDARTRSEICALLARRNERMGMALLIASHDPRVLRAVTEHLFVFYAGQLVESGRTEEILERPLHPYTGALLSCFELEHRKESGTPGPFRTIPGSAPVPNVETSGCRFVSRCPRRRRACSELQPALLPAGPEREVRCLLYD
jgi:oligopeptide/dipeptide ABC transporter ATP-binding protein